ncbi:hypothetical protein CLV58_109130 [Spirosoma oryzae]|uniref:Uncharacterized protein n=1 Tax=Spirosoma oryzae TaxID=1469603 RepID=A0A2T0SYG2_9BACT|nr:hypothetical protein [Spirosoma oryzae]PRY38403.1 hypothetical protein CLV58_109130 [Spirosoma oryzae]
MDYLPITYYHIGQPIEINGMGVTNERSTITELTRHHITYRVTEPGKTDYTTTVHPNFVKPVLRPLSQIRISHVIELFRLTHPESAHTDDFIIDYFNQDPGRIEYLSDSTEAVLWLQSLYYDVGNLIPKGLAVTDE